MAKDNKSTATIWGVRSVVVTVVSTLAGFILGTIVTLWVAVDVEHAEKIKTLENAVFELHYNIDMVWYNDEKFINTTNRFPELRDKALWELYYHRGNIWVSGEQAVVDNLLECLNEIDWINRDALSQYFVGDALFTEGPMGADGKHMGELQTTFGPNIVMAHKAMVDHYKTRTQPLMLKLLPYLESKQSDTD
jgi:hypothetical protein